MRFVLALLASAALALGVAQYLVPPGVAPWLANGSWTAASVFAVAGLAVAVRRVEGPTRRAWRYLLAASVSWLAGQLLRDLGSVLETTPLVPSVADATWFAFAVLAGVALYRLAPAPPTIRRLALLDVAALALAVATLASSSFYEAALASPLSFAGKATALAYPVLFAAVVVIMLQAMVRAGRASAHPAFLLVFGAVLLEAVAFVLWTPKLLASSYVPGTHPIDVLWPLGLLALGAGGLLARSGEVIAASDDEDLRWTSALPYGTLLALLVALTVSVLADRPRGVDLALHGGLYVVAAVLYLRARLLVRWNRGLLAGERASVAALTETEKALRRAQEENERFFTLSIDMLCIADFRGYFKRVNPAFERVLGHTADELVSRPFLDFVHPGDREATLAEVATLSAGVPSVSFENRYRCTDGSYRWLHWNAAPAREEELIYAVAHDVTERRRAEEQLRESAERLERTNGELEAFAYTASHDLKGPLVSIEGFASSLERRAGAALDERSRMYVERIRANAGALQRLIQDLFEFARVGAQTETPAVVDADALAHEVVAAFEERAAATGARVDLVSAVPALRAHPVRFKQALSNLIENALAHAGGGDRVRIAIAAAGRNGHVEIAVQDNGAGVPEAEREKMFDLFTRGRGAASTSPEGTGMGLALVKKIMESSGGSVRYEQVATGGARFLLTFPKGEL